MKNRKITIIFIVIASFLMKAGIVKAAGLTVDSLTVGKQGVGGVTFFNGTIINNTTGTGGTDNPVTFGDNVRIDGRVYRGATAGPSDDRPFTINDNVEIAGSLKIAGQTVTLVDYTSRFDTLDSVHSTMNSDLSLLKDDTSTIKSNLDLANTNINSVKDDVGATNDSVDNAISVTTNAYDNQVDLLNNIAWHGYINCVINVIFLGEDPDVYCIVPTYISYLEESLGYKATDSNKDNPRIKEFQEKTRQLFEFVKNKK